ncbi:copper chaperone PCu(A)C, partial [Pseudomonas syringae pv. tagetis]
MLKNALLRAALMVSASLVQAHEYKAGPLLIGHPGSMELPPKAPTVAAYLNIENNVDSAQLLISFETPIDR